MMNEGFISPSINVEDAVEEIGDINLVTKENSENINSFMSNSFGFGGTNACLILVRIKELLLFSIFLENLLASPLTLNLEVSRSFFQK